MTAIVIRPDDPEAVPALFRASTGSCQAVGRTRGEALDVLASQLALPSSAAIFIRGFGSDEFFTQAQHDRMQALVNRRADLKPEEQQELEIPIDAELAATVLRLEEVMGSLPE